MEFKRISKQKVQRNGAIASNGSGSTSYVNINNNSGQGQGQGSLSVDSLLSLTSVNPVENRTITTALQGKADRDSIINRDRTLKIEVTDTSIYIDSSTFHFDSSGNLAYNGTVKVNEIGAEYGAIDNLAAVFIASRRGSFVTLHGDTLDTSSMTANLAQIITAQTTHLQSNDASLYSIQNTSLNSKDATIENLSVTGSAHFFKLIIDELKSNAGAVIVTSANCTADRVDLWTNYYRVYFRASDPDGKKITNSWRVNDQAICQTFDAATGTSYNVSNKYYWRLVVGVSSSPITLADGNQYHYIDLSRQSGNYVGTSAPETGDNIVQLGYRGTDDEARQSAIIISAYQTPDTALAAPSLAFYQGIKTFALAAYRKTYFDATRNHFEGDFYLGPNQSLTQYVQNAVDNIDISDVTEGVFKLRP